jgi:hypothetical protein
MADVLLHRQRLVILSAGDCEADSHENNGVAETGGCPIAAYREANHSLRSFDRWLVVFLCDRATHVPFDLDWFIRSADLAALPDPNGAISPAQA